MAPLFMLTVAALKQTVGHYCVSKGFRVIDSPDKAKIPGQRITNNSQI